MRTKLREIKNEKEGLQDKARMNETVDTHTVKTWGDEHTQYEHE